MRDRFKLKFWDNTDKELGEVINIDFNTEFVDFKTKDGITSTRLKSGELIQCTGLKDKSGKLIYEGDIVKIFGFPCKIVFELGEFCIVRNCKFITLDDWYELLYEDNWNDDTYSLAQLYFNTEGEENFIDNVEIIGNIHENPELLEAKND